MSKRIFPLDRETALAIFNQLLAWREETDPDGGDATAVRKSYYANQSLFFTSLLIESVVGWAIHHRIGVDVAGLDLQQNQSKKADLHDFEELGSTWTPGNPAQDREILASLVQIGGIVPTILREPLGQALHALNLGEQDPLVAPSREGRWRGSHSLSRPRMFAVMHVFFRWGRKTPTKKQALEKVAKTMDVSVETLRTWERRWLPEALPGVEDFFAISKRAGAVQRCLDEDPDCDPDDKVAIALCHFLLDSHSLQKIAEQHRQVLRTARGSNRGVG